MLADDVIGVFNEAAFLAPRLLQMFAGGTRLPGLKELAQAAVLAAHFLNGFTRILMALAVGRHVDDAQVYTDHANRREDFGLFYRDRAGQVERPVAQE